MREFRRGVLPASWDTIPFFQVRKEFAMVVRRVMLLLAAVLVCLQTGCASHFCATGACGAVPGGVVTECSDCGGGGCGSCLGRVKSHIHAALTCGSGCGDLVWDEWIDNPPDCCDPCNDCGQWTGIRSCLPSPFNYCNLWGARTGDCSAGCSTCTETVGYVDSAPLQKGGVIIEQKNTTPTTTPAPEQTVDEFAFPAAPPTATSRPARRGYLFQ